MCLMKYVNYDPTPQHTLESPGIIRFWKKSYKFLFDQKKTPILPSPLGNSCKMVFIKHLHYWFFPTYFPISYISPYFSHVALSTSLQKKSQLLVEINKGYALMVFAASGLIGRGCPLWFLENTCLSHSLYFTPKNSQCGEK